MCKLLEHYVRSFLVRQKKNLIDGETNLPNM